jgi:ubiquinone/menaquinone biosynthesis C-methylase UbiE
MPHIIRAKLIDTLFFYSTIILCLSLPGSEVFSQEHSVRPGINRAYLNPIFSEWVARFERPGREIYDKQSLIVATTGTRAGMTIADIGAGTGLFTPLFASQVGPRGHVIAVDISSVFIENILRRSEEQGLTNVRGIVNTANDVSLPENSIDLAFICDTYHHFEYPRSTMRSVHRALRPEGTLVIIDFRKIPGVSTPWVMNHVRADKNTVIREIEDMGFKLIGDEPILRTNYFLRFEKR